MSGHRLEAGVGRVLGVLTLVAVGLVAVGSLLLLASGRSPLAAAPPLDPPRLLGDVIALQPAGFLWLGLLLVVATPAARVVAALIGYVGAGERTMALVGVLILVVIGGGVVAGLAGA